MASTNGTEWPWTWTSCPTTMPKGNLFDEIVTEDEKWVHFIHEMKSASKQWAAESDNYPVKAKWKKLAGEVYLTAFWDNQGILLEEYGPKSVTLMETYFDTFLCLWEAIKKKYPGKLHKAWSCYMTMPDLTRLNSSHLFSTIFAGTCSGTPHIRPISHPPVTIRLQTPVENFRKIVKFPRNSEKFDQCKFLPFCPGSVVWYRISIWFQVNLSI